MARFISKFLFCLGGFFVGSVFLDWLFWGFFGGRGLFQIKIVFTVLHYLPLSF